MSTQESEKIHAADPEKATLPVAAEDDQLSSESDNQDKNKRSITGIKWVLVLMGTLSSVLFFSLDNSIVADVQPQIIQAFHEIDKLPWLSVAFALGTVATTLIWASVYSTFDTKITFIIANVIFQAGSAICGASNKMDVLIFGRALAGLGGAGLYLGALTLVSALTTPAERPLYIASMGIVWGTGSVIGPVVGGGFAESSATWRWAFYINLPVGALFAPVILFLIPSVNPQPNRSVRDKFSNMDYAGAFLICAGFCCITCGLSFGGSLFPWKSAETITLIAISIPIFAAFAVQQVFCWGTSKENRLLPVQYFSHRTLFILFILGILSAVAIFVPIYFISLFFQFAKGDGALKAAGRLAPFLVVLVISCVMQGGVMGKDGRYAPWYLGSSALVIIGSALMYTVDSETSTSKVYGYSVILGFGAGSVIQTGFTVSQAIVPRSEMSLAVAFANLSQLIGIVVALIVANSIFLNVAQNSVGRLLPNATPLMIKSAISGTGSTVVRNLSPELRAKVLDGIIDAISKTYIFVIACSSSQFLLSLLLKWEKVFQDL